MDGVAQLVFDILAKADEHSFAEASKNVKDLSNEVQKAYAEIEKKKKAAQAGDAQALANAEGRILKWKNALVKTLGAIGVGLSLKAMNSIAEEFDGINDSIKGATRELGNQESIQRLIMDSADRCRESYGSMARSAIDLVKQNPSIGIERAVQYSEQFTKLLKSAGKSTGEISSAASLMNRVFANGAMDVGTLTRMMRSQPEIVNLLTKSLGKTREELEQMAKDGKLTTDVILEAFQKSSETIQKQFEENALTFSDCVTYARNHWGQFCAFIWDKGGIFNDLAKKILEVEKKLFGALEKHKYEIARVVRNVVTGIGKIIDVGMSVLSFIGEIIERLGGVEYVLNQVFQVIAFIMALNFINSIIGGISAIIGMLTPVTFMLAALFLIVQDIVYFVLDKNSLLEQILNDLGVDVDGVREKIGEWKKEATAFFDVLVGREADVDGLSDSFKNGPLQMLESAKQISDAIHERWQAIGYLWKAATAKTPQERKEYFDLAMGKSQSSMKNEKEGRRNLFLGAVNKLFGTDYKYDSEKDYSLKPDELFGSKGQMSGGGGGSKFGPPRPTPKEEYSDGEWLSGSGRKFYIGDEDWQTGKDESGKSSGGGKGASSGAGGVKEYAQKKGGKSSSSTQTETTIVKMELDEASGEEVKTNVAATAKEAGEGGTEQLKTSLESGGKKVSEDVGAKTSTDMVNSFNNEFESTGKNEIVKTAEDIGTEAGEKSADKAADAINGPGKEKLKAAAQTAGSEAGTELVNAVDSSLSGLAERAVVWGADMVQGFVRGINENKGLLTSAVAGLASEVDSQMGFSRPDKGPLADYETWMPDMIHGLAQTFGSNTGLLLGEVSALAGNMRDAMVPALDAMTLSSGSGAGVTHNSSRSVNQSVVINNRFESTDREMFVQGAKTMDRSAKDATTYMAEALSFGG